MTFTQAHLAHEGDAEITSLFILGPSRSGKTPLESILASARDVKRGNENPIAVNALRKTSLWIRQTARRWGQPKRSTANA